MVLTSVWPILTQTCFDSNLDCTYGSTWPWRCNTNLLLSNCLTTLPGDTPVENATAASIDTFMGLEPISQLAYSAIANEASPPPLGIFNLLFLCASMISPMWSCYVLACSWFVKVFYYWESQTDNRNVPKIHGRGYLLRYIPSHLLEFHIVILLLPK